MFGLLAEGILLADISFAHFLDLRREEGAGVMGAMNQGSTEQNHGSLIDRGATAVDFNDTNHANHARFRPVDNR